MPTKTKALNVKLQSKTCYLEMHNIYSFVKISMRSICHAIYKVYANSNAVTQTYFRNHCMSKVGIQKVNRDPINFESQDRHMSIWYWM
jgi:hypothetical protein